MTSILMDVVLMGLLIAALWFGVRLDKKLKALRAAHEGFAQAVGQLDDAAIRAHQSLKELRGNAEESQELLHGRIVAARELLQRLETQSTRAERTVSDLDKGIQAAEAARLMQMQTPVVRPAATDPLTLRNVIATAPLRDSTRQTYAGRGPTGRGPTGRGPTGRGPTGRGPFDRDMVREDAPPPRLETARPVAERAVGSRLPEVPQDDETEILDKVQMSELVVANLNEMIRTLNMPRRQPEKTVLSVEDELFGPDSSRK